MTQQVFLRLLCMLFLLMPVYTCAEETSEISSNMQSLQLNSKKMLSQSFEYVQAATGSFSTITQYYCNAEQTQQAHGLPLLQTKYLDYLKKIVAQIQITQLKQLFKTIKHDLTGTFQRVYANVFTFFNAPNQSQQLVKLTQTLIHTFDDHWQGYSIVTFFVSKTQASLEFMTINSSDLCVASAATQGYYTQIKAYIQKFWLAPWVAIEMVVENYHALEPQIKQWYTQSQIIWQKIVQADFDQPTGLNLAALNEAMTEGWSQATPTDPTAIDSSDVIDSPDLIVSPDLMKLLITWRDKIISLGESLMSNFASFVNYEQAETSYRSSDQ